MDQPSPDAKPSTLRRLRRTAGRVVRGTLRPPLAAMRGLQWFLRGSAAASRMDFQPAPPSTAEVPNDFRRHVDSVRTGPGIWKWSHYLDVYERHFSRFRGRPVTIAEIGIYSGGSIAMWRDYFGPQCRVIGVDIEDSCRVYAGDGIEVIIGDQSDPAFWQRFFAAYPDVDIVVDDGGHMVHQQVPTLEAVLPHLRPGGVYLCEDVHDRGNDFHFYVAGLLRELNATQTTVDLDNPERRVVSRSTRFQAAVHSAHFYPYVVVIERRDADVAEFVAPKRGTQWQPFGDAWDELTKPSAPDAKPSP